MEIQRVYTSFLRYMQARGMTRMASARSGVFDKEVARMLDLHNETQERQFALLASDMERLSCRSYYVQRFSAWAGADGVYEVRLQIK